jgi:hypothetical protein
MMSIIGECNLRFGRSQMRLRIAGSLVALALVSTW